MSRCAIEPALDTNGKQIYPDLNVHSVDSATVKPDPFQIRFVERENRLVV